MRHEDTQAAANWSILLGGLLLFVSLFLTWSHQVPPSWLGRDALIGVRVAPDAWQVYSATDILLCLLALWLGWCAVTSRAAVRSIGAALVCGALAFVAHALAAPPTNGVPVAHAARSGAGEVVALVGLALALAGLAAAGLGHLAGSRRPNVQVRPS